MKILKYSGVLIVMAVLLFSCKQEPKFTVTGTISGAKGDTLYLEKRGFTDVSVVDSAIIDNDGKFTIKSATPEFPDLYLLRLGKQSINLSVDSTETITIDAPKNNFATEYTVEGSQSTMMMKEIIALKSMLEVNIELLKKDYLSNTISQEDYLSLLQTQLASYKDKVMKLIIKDLKSPAAYFALFQKLDGYLIFDPMDKKDSKMYAAVATSWDMYHKESPRAKHLKAFALSSMKERRDAEKKIGMLENAGVNSESYYNIDLPTISGQKVSLSSLKGKVVLLDFTVYQAQESPAHNIALNKIYEQHRGAVEIYQVSLDSDMHFWQNAASNLPWICVRDAASVTSELVQKYNIQSLPTIFVLDRQGELVKRLSPTDNIDSEVKKLL